MGLYKSFVSQTRKPEGFLGKMMVSGMNARHARLADWGFTEVTSDHHPSRPWITVLARK